MRKAAKKSIELIGPRPSHLCLTVLENPLRTHA